MAVVEVPDAPVSLSTASVYPESAATAFELAARLGYDGVEVMVWSDPVSQDVTGLQALADYHSMPVTAVHAPCLAIAQRVWGADPWAKLVRARDAAVALGAGTVVVHPPFRWQRSYARDFAARVVALEAEGDVSIAVENMFPLRARGRRVTTYTPGYDPTDQDFTHFTLDLSHAAVSGDDVLAMADRMGDRLSHLHVTDGTGGARDEHLVPGRGAQPCAVLLERLARNGFAGNVVVEINTRGAATRAEREADLAEALAYTRLHFAAAVAT